jgi:hypothetical protein
VLPMNCEGTELANPNSRHVSREGGVQNIQELTQGTVAVGCCSSFVITTACSWRKIWGRMHSTINP